MNTLKGVVLFLLLAFCASADESHVNVLYPTDGDVQGETSVNVVMEIKNGGFDLIRIITPMEQTEIVPKAQKKTECKSVSLKLGENRVIVRVYKEGKLLQESDKDVFVVSELNKFYKYPPKGYARSYFHDQKSENACASCHDMSVNETEGRAFVDITKSNCFTCHKNITKEKYAHAPAANWLCTSCHEKNDSQKTKYGVKKPIIEACFDCHQENKEQWSAAKYRHEPLDTGECDRCHNPHSSPYSMFLRQEVNYICIGCHKNKNMHAINGVSACMGNMGKSICTECHTPHATNRPVFLKEGVQRSVK